MIQPEHMADLIVYVAKMPRACALNEVVISADLESRLRVGAGIGPKAPL